MLNRSLERDYDVSYHRRAILKCLEDIREHTEALVAVDFDPYGDLDNAEDQCAILKEEYGGTLS